MRFFAIDSAYSILKSVGRRVYFEIKILFKVFLFENVFIFTFCNSGNNSITMEIKNSALYIFFTKHAKSKTDNYCYIFQRKHS